MECPTPECKGELKSGNKRVADSVDLLRKEFKAELNWHLKKFTITAGFVALIFSIGAWYASNALSQSSTVLIASTARNVEAQQKMYAEMDRLRMGLIEAQSMTFAHTSTIRDDLEARINHLEKKIDRR